MLLRRLSEYADRLDLPPPLYSETPIRYVVHLREDGTPLTRMPIDTADPSSPAQRRGTRRLAPQVARAVGIKPLLLADNAEYTFGLARPDSRPERVRNCHSAYLALLDRCEAATGAASVAAVRAFLSSDPLDHIELPDAFDPGALVTFRVGDVFPIDVPSVQAFWSSTNDPAASGARVMQCVVCGQQLPVLTRLQGKVKGVPRGQQAGTSLVSANAAAFESYGLEASLIAPTCSTCGERFTKALNALLADDDHHAVIGDAVYVFWTRRPVAFSLRRSVVQPEAGAVRELVAAVRSGGLPPDVASTEFYAIVLSASGGRTVVRDWIDTTVGTVAARLADWYGDLWIVARDGGEPVPFGPYALGAATVRDASKELTAATVRALLHAALTGTPPSRNLLARAIRRTHAGTTVVGGRTVDLIPHARAALVKLVLVRHGLAGMEADTLIGLNTDHPNPAYHCGRLLAVLDDIQRNALGDVNATVVDRFYGTASSAPASVFQRLLGGARPHLAKLRRDRPGTYRALDRRLGEVILKVSGFPRVLTLADQGLFALGFYHQRAFDWQQRRDAAQRRRDGLPPTDPDARLHADDDATAPTEEE